MNRENVTEAVQIPGGARADEAARLMIEDLDLGTSAAVRILGKGVVGYSLPQLENGSR